MKLQAGLSSAVKALVDELMVSFPLDAFEAQRILIEQLRSQEVIRFVRSRIEMHEMEEGMRVVKAIPEEGL